MATVLTTVGKGLVTALLTASGPQHIGWGTGATTAVVGDTGLVTPAAPARVAGTRSQATTTVSNDSYQVQGTLTAGGPLAITEAGLFDGAGTGSPPTGAALMVRGDFAAINLASGDSIQFTVKVALG